MYVVSIMYVYVCVFQGYALTYILCMPVMGYSCFPKISTSEKCNENALIHIICSKCVGEGISQGSVEREGMDLLARPGQAGEEQKLPSSMTLRGLPVEGVAHIKGVSSPPQDPD